MAYTTAEARQQLLDAVADATDQIGLALASLGAAYEEVDERTADELEERLFGPVQRAYGRAKRTHAQFAARHALASRPFASHSPRLTAGGARGHVEDAVAAIVAADDALAALQDSLLPVEVGDPELRAGLSEVRSLLGGLPGQARELLRRLGR